MRIAAIRDTHGNVLALRAALADACTRGVDTNGSTAIRSAGSYSAR